MNIKETMKKLAQINESYEGDVSECGNDMAPAQQVAAPMTPPDIKPTMSVNVSVNANASGTEHVNDLIDIMKNAGLVNTAVVSEPSHGMRQDMETFRSAVDGTPDDSYDVNLPVVTSDEPTPMESGNVDVEQEYMDLDYMNDDLAGGINRKKRAYKSAQKGDNAMAVEAMKEKLYKKLAGKKSE